MVFALYVTGAALDGLVAASQQPTKYGPFTAGVNASFRRNALKNSGIQSHGKAPIRHATLPISAHDQDVARGPSLTGISSLKLSEGTAHLTTRCSNSPPMRCVSGRFAPSVRRSPLRRSHRRCGASPMCVAERTGSRGKRRLDFRMQRRPVRRAIERGEVRLCHQASGPVRANTIAMQAVAEIPIGGSRSWKSVKNIKALWKTR